LAHRIIAHGLVRPGETLLDIGCGPGNLSFAMAQKKVRVTALDNSPGMIQVVKQRLKNRPALPVEPLAADWKKFSPQIAHDVAAAVFFPEACTAKGLFSMEKLAARTCILVTGDGRETFPVRRDIWNQVMAAPCPSAGFHMECAQNFLRAAGRSPQRFSLCLPVVLDAEEQAVKDYFWAYFTMFDTCPKKLDNAIRNALLPHLARGRVQIKGNAGLEVLFWQVEAEEKKI
ncbi:MAG: methyltransferase domain-containing protein, partial [Proteobacteria bacterium]|nr:methyltransferase domain-containing protein [Pseudomonadota bacterium]